MSNKYFKKPELIKIYLKRKYIWPARILTFIIALYFGASTLSMYDAGYVTGVGVRVDRIDDPFGFFLGFVFRGSIMLLIVWLLIGGIRQAPESNND